MVKTVKMYMPTLLLSTCSCCTFFRTGQLLLGMRYRLSHPYTAWCGSSATEDSMRY